MPRAGRQRPQGSAAGDARELFAQCWSLLDASGESNFEGAGVRLFELFGDVARQVTASG
ncbi:hypothetical protein OG211_34015 [Streptomyces niveus]|uniref:hypothetical protein n=1 Tax=Streptomyces niveus TaxID=193462 RepID=UPI00386F6ABB|nr:hypothetical protein OG211_34015 [Streptomyces niveus]